ncbi:leupeptin-inactivating enzyme 1 precursor [Trematosphaeria pertusa]|uniref:Peptide hydrolase n=1 Tax=Trematosphaeria pertusa TaxID=390896 RepID=A0A6A6HVL7_9PLEO|nr:leupeptin-inactivating enzyme 1 precursor [Trematosphaeria pertusa]KAF2242215.1 leupeptin-inactivating enzyme 1 precursor [Trematosphaeria pertusa]
MWKSIVVLAVFAAATANAAVLDPRNNLVESEKLRRRINVDALEEKAQLFERFAYDSPDKNRVIGSAGHDATVKYITDMIKKFPHYYTVTQQPMPLSVGISANLTINGKETEAYAVGLAPGGHATGSVVAIPNLGCNATDFPNSLNGSIALIYRGTCVSGEKVAFATERGAAGVLIYNNVEGNLNGYSLQRIPATEGEYVPTAGISQAAGEGLVALLEIGTEVIVDMTTTAKDVTSYNIIAQTKGGDQDNVIHIGGHSDSVAAGPGINDNGSGSISILEVAIQLMRFSVNNAVRFSWWTAEEEGLLGSEFYVKSLSQAEKDKIRLFLDFDMMASPNYAFQIYDGDGSAFNSTGPPGSSEAEAEFTHYFRDIAKVNHTEIEFDGRSDYGPFMEAGIAAGGIACGAEGIKTQEEFEMFGGAAGVPYDVNYHEDGDTTNNLNYEAWIQMTRAIAHVTATYARSFDSLPPKNSSAVRMKRDAQMFRYKTSSRYLSMI